MSKHPCKHPSWNRCDIYVSQSCWDYVVKHVKMSSFLNVGISNITNLCYARSLTSRQHESNIAKITFALVRIPDDAIDIIWNYIQMPAGIHVFRLEQAWKHWLDHSNTSLFFIKLAPCQWGFHPDSHVYKLMINYSMIPDHKYYILALDCKVWCP